ncbi:hypothetical protein GQ53DRAFT_765508 [Thozetella sp. PMI_491]|nr:hypothetical protein GQ53DRAFT_765508 [Thozetella sp. PMI_491]
MATVLGKRKTRHVEDESADGLAQAQAQAHAQAVFQRHFEASFAPLAVEPYHKPPVGGASDDDESDNETVTDESGSEWGGVSDAEEGDGDDDAELEIINHAASSEPTATMSKRELKAFMSSRPPSAPALERTPHATSRKGKRAGDQDEDSQAFLANDLALQRLISESHILARAGGNPSHFSAGSRAEAADGGGKLFAAGRTRRLTTEMRLEQAMGREAAVPKQAKMPMAMRKGIARHAAGREEKRRREARENGVVLERKGGKAAKNAAKGRRGAGEAPVDLPGVGKMRGSELRLSARDVRSIQGPQESSLTRRKKRR